jgi:hypothetical protein
MLLVRLTKKGFNMKIEDKKLYFNSSMIGEVVLSFSFLVVTLALYFFYGSKESILYFSGFLFVVFIFSTLEMIRNIKQRIFAESTVYRTFKSKIFVLPLLFLVYSFGAWYLYDYQASKEKSSFIVGLLFPIFFIGCVEMLASIVWNFRKFCRTYNKKPSFHWISNNKLNKKFTDNAIYIVKYDNEPEILHAYENHFTVAAQRGNEYVDYDEGRQYIYYKDKKLIPSQLEKYMIKYKKTFADMTDNDIALLEMQNI